MNLFSPAIGDVHPALKAGSEREALEHPAQPPAWLAVLGVVAALGAVMVMALATVNQDFGSWTNLVDDLGLIFAIAACLHASLRTIGDTQKMWRLLTAAVCLWTVGEAIFDVRVIGLGLDPSNTVTDLFYMAFYPLMIAGLLARDRSARKGGFDIRMLDSVVVALAVSVVAYGLVFNNPLTADAQAVGPVAEVGYPLLIGLLIWMITYQLSSRTIVWDATRSLLACAVAALFASSVLWSMVGGVASGAAMSLAMTFVGFAALASPRQTRVRATTEHGRRTIIPEVVLFFAYGGVVAVLASRFYAFDPVLTILAAVAMFVVVSRLILAFAQNERLLDSSERRGATDSLTGLANLQHYRERLDGEIARTTREGGSFALLLIDIDHFKSVNDIAGHRAGDQVLIAVAETMRETFRPFDVVCRVGGDELAVIAPNTSETDAIQMAWRLCGAVQDISIEEFPDLPAVSVSIGCSAFPALAKDATELIDHADEALYRVKQNQRGGAELYSADAPHPTGAGSQLARIQAQLAARDADFQAVFRHAKEAMAIIDGQGTVLLINDQAARMFGTNRDKIVGSRASELLETSEGAEFESLLPQMSADGALEGKLQVRPKGTSKMTIEFSASRFAPDRFLTILRDVTARDQEAAELTASERQFRALFTSSLDPIFVTDDGGFVRDANPAAAKMTGRRLDQLIGCRVDELVHPEEMGEVIEQVDGLRDLQTARGTFTTRDSDGVKRTVEYSSVADFVPGLHLTNVREIIDQQ